MAEEVEAVFPDTIDRASIAEFYSNVKRKAEIQYKQMVGGAVDAEAETAIEEYFYGLIKPSEIYGRTGRSIQYNKDFEAVCAVITQEISRDPKKMTVMEYMQIVESMKKRVQEQKKSMRRGK